MQRAHCVCARTCGGLSVLSGMKVTRPALCCCSSRVQRSATSSVSTTTWNRLLAAGACRRAHKTHALNASRLSAHKTAARRSAAGCAIKPGTAGAAALRGAHRRTHPTRPVAGPRPRRLAQTDANPTHSACAGLAWCLICLAADPSCVTRAVARSADARCTHTRERAECAPAVTSTALWRLGGQVMRSTRRPATPWTPWSRTRRSRLDVPLATSRGMVLMKACAPRYTSRHDHPVLTLSTRHTLSGTHAREKGTLDGRTQKTVNPMCMQAGRQGRDIWWRPRAHLLPGGELGPQLVGPRPRLLLGAPALLARLHCAQAARARAQKQGPRQAVGARQRARRPVGPVMRRRRQRARRRAAALSCRCRCARCVACPAPARWWKQAGSEGVAPAYPPRRAAAPARGPRPPAPPACPPAPPCSAASSGPPAQPTTTSPTPQPKRVRRMRRSAARVCAASRREEWACARDVQNPRPSPKPPCAHARR